MMYGLKPFAGNAYVIGKVNNRGGNTAAASTVQEMSRKIAFLGKGTIE